MVSWNNLDTIKSYNDLEGIKHVNLVEAMSGDNGAKRVKEYSVPMAAGLAYNYAAKEVDDNIIAALDSLAKET